MEPGIARFAELSELAQLLDDQPLGPAHQLYFPFHEAPGDVRGADAIADLRACISIRAARESCQLFSGFWGSGKSTELRRLEAELTSLGHPVIVVPAGRVLNLYKAPEVTDLMVSVAAGVAQEMTAKKLGSVAAKTSAERFQAFFARLQLKEIKLGAGIGNESDPVQFVSELSFELAKDASFKAQMQEALRGKLAVVTEEFRKFMEDVRRALEVDTKAPSPVLIVDDLEKLQGSGREDVEVQSSVEQIFASFHDQLKVSKWHLVWAVPPYLQLLNAKIPQQYDNSVVLPMVRLWHNDQSRSRDEAGLAAMQNCLEKRGPVRSLFPDEPSYNEVIKASSGHLRSLMKLVQRLVSKAYQKKDSAKQVTRDDVYTVIQDHVRGQQNAMFKEDDPWLIEIAEHRSLRPNNELSVPRLARLLDTAVVMSYRNGDQWLDICYAAQELLQYKKG